MVNFKFLICSLVLYIGVLCGCRQKVASLHVLRNQVEQIIAGRNAIVGVSVIGSNGMDTLSLYGNRRFPMQSVFKFHIALAVLAEVDKGRFAMDQTFLIKKEDLLPQEVWSPLRDDNPDGGIFTLKQLIQYTVSYSDNTACDMLIQLIGTPKDVEKYIKHCGIADIQITFNEQEMQAKWDNMFENWTTPIAASETLKLFYENKNGLLTRESYSFFWQTNKETSTGNNRIKGKLPAGTVVAHKTGWSGTHMVTGITEAVNNIGIVFLPDGKYFFLSVFVTQSKESFEENEAIIAEIAKATYDFYTLDLR